MGVAKGSVAVLLLSRCAAAARPVLQFTKNGTFQITVFEDLHFGEAEDTNWGPLQDVDTLKVMQTVLDNEMPQLVVLNGDLITGEDTLKENSTDYVDKIVAPLVKAGLPWASTYGSKSPQVPSLCPCNMSPRGMGRFLPLHDFKSSCREEQFF